MNLSKPPAAANRPAAASKLSPLSWSNGRDLTASLKPLTVLSIELTRVNRSLVADSDSVEMSLFVLSKSFVMSSDSVAMSRPVRRKPLVTASNIAVLSLPRSTSLIVFGMSVADCSAVKVACLSSVPNSATACPEDLSPRLFM